MSLLSRKIKEINAYSEKHNISFSKEECANFKRIAANNNIDFVYNEQRKKRFIQFIKQQINIAEQKEAGLGKKIWDYVLEKFFPVNEQALEIKKRIDYKVLKKHIELLLKPLNLLDEDKSRIQQYLMEELDYLKEHGEVSTKLNSAAPNTDLPPLEKAPRLWKDAPERKPIIFVVRTYGDYIDNNLLSLKKLSELDPDLVDEHGELLSRTDLFYDCKAAKSRSQLKQQYKNDLMADVGRKNTQLAFDIINRQRVRGYRGKGTDDDTITAKDDFSENANKPQHISEKIDELFEDWINQDFDAYKVNRIKRRFSKEILSAYQFDFSSQNLTPQKVEEEKEKIFISIMGYDLCNELFKIVNTNKTNKFSMEKAMKSNQCN